MNDVPAPLVLDNDLTEAYSQDLITFSVQLWNILYNKPWLMKGIKEGGDNTGRYNMEWW